MQVTYLSQNTKNGQQLVQNDPIWSNMVHNLRERSKIWTPNWSDWSKMAHNGPTESEILDQNGYLHDFSKICPDFSIEQVEI